MHLSYKCDTSRCQRIRKYCARVSSACESRGAFSYWFHANIVFTQSANAKTLCWWRYFRAEPMQRLEMEPRKKAKLCTICLSRVPPFTWLLMNWISFSILFMFHFPLSFSPTLDILLVCNVRREYLPSIWCFLHPSYGCHFPFPIELTAARHKRLHIALFIFSTRNLFPIDVLVHTRINSLKST